ISSVPEPINYSSGENTQCDISEQLPIYDQGTSSILVPQLPESQSTVVKFELMNLSS
ncbi:unnamed protein product, partial [Rotaria magnacalcarata]